MSELSGLQVLDLEGNVRELSDLWTHKPAVITWLRHYG